MIFVIKYVLINSDKHAESAERKAMNKNTRSIMRLTYLSVLIAIMLIFAFTPIGYIKMPGIEITLMVIPVAVGAIVLGPAAGAILGGVFGLTSFIQCFGMSAFGTFLLGLNPVLTFIMCFIPRILCGYLSGLFFKVLIKFDKTKLASYFASSLSTALLNTIFFVGCVVLFFWRNPAFISTMGEWGMTTDTLWAFIVGFIALNGVIEAAVNFIVAGAVAKALHKFVKVN